MATGSAVLQAILNSWLGGGASLDLHKRKTNYSVATCPDPQCGAVIYFPSHEASVECIGCGQRHTCSLLSDVRQLSDKEETIQRSLTEMKSLFGGKKTAELVKVKGISNYQCKLLSPLLTTHGKDKNDQPCLLKDLHMGDTFDCGKLANRSFAIEQSMLEINGYGQDKSGSLRYLKETLADVDRYNGQSKCLVPIHADGDGHCLVHAISRCIVGRELFWHALRTNMHTHLSTNKQWYIDKLKDFYEESEWDEIIDEAGPDYQPPSEQSLGLRTVHIFALANVLHRPIVLLDSKTGMQSKGEYSSIFLPSFYTPDQCSSGGVLNSPLVIAWSSSGYNHFIPLVPIKDRPLPKLPVSLQPKVWCEEERKLSQYVHIEDDGSITLCRGKPLQDSYLQKLVTCMEKLFVTQNGVSPSLVADVNQHVYRNAGCVGVSLATVTMETKSATDEGRLFRCLYCSAISNVPQDWLSCDGMLYEIASNEYSLEDGQKYTFPRYGISAQYNKEQNRLIPFDVNCFSCTQASRSLQADGTINYENGDRTTNRADPTYSKCCGFKHFWNGKEYDNLPQPISFNLSWKGRVKPVMIYWFQNERDSSLNSNIYEVANQTVAEHFPGEFGSEQLVQRVVDMIVEATDKMSDRKQEEEDDNNDDVMDTQNDLNTPITKTIITGMTKGTKTLHKEELGISEAERLIKKRVDNKIHQMNTTTPTDTPPKTARKTSPTPTINELSSSNKVSPDSKKVSPKPSPPPLAKDHKRIRVTSSEGKNTNLTLSNTATFTDLQLLIEQELQIPVNDQKLRWGFPPKELTTQDPSSPLSLAHGERVTVERINRSVPTSAERTEVGGASPDVSSLLKDFNAFTHLERFPSLFRKGGYCYDELLATHQHKLKDHTHVQFAEMPEIVFRYNASEECLEVCLGTEHVPVGPLTNEQKKQALLATEQSKSGHGSDKEEGGGATDSVKWLINRNPSRVKAFSGAGHTLGGGASDEEQSTVQSKLDEISNYSQSLLQAAQMIVSSRLNELRKRERELLTEIQILNKKLQSENEPYDMNRGQLERKLLDMSSELKELRNELKELAEI